MSSQEKPISVVNNFNIDGFTRTIGDLMFTDRRVIFVKTVGGADVWAWILGLFGNIVSREKATKISNEIAKMPIEDLIHSAYKTDVYPYEILEEVRLKPRSLMSSQITLRFRNGKRKKYWGKLKDLQQTLDSQESIKAVGAPITVDAGSSSNLTWPEPADEKLDTADEEYLDYHRNRRKAKPPLPQSNSPLE